MASKVGIALRRPIEVLTITSCAKVQEHALRRRFPLSSSELQQIPLYFPSRKRSFARQAVCEALSHLPLISSSCNLSQTTPPRQFLRVRWACSFVVRQYRSPVAECLGATSEAAGTSQGDVQGDGSTEATRAEVPFVAGSFQSVEWSCRAPLGKFQDMMTRKFNADCPLAP